MKRSTNFSTFFVIIIIGDNMKCSRCGREVGEKEFFCLSCGNELDNDVKKESVSKITKEDNSEEESNSEKDNTLFIVLPILIIGVLCGLFILKQPVRDDAEGLTRIITFFTGASIIVMSVMIPAFVIILKAFTNISNNNKK